MGRPAEIPLIEFGSTSSPQDTMGAVLSTYAGSNDIGSFASTSKDDAKEYDYVICGGECGARS